MTLDEQLVNEFSHWFDFVADVFIATVCFGAVLVWRKTGARVRRVRTQLLRCVAMTIRRPSRLFMLSLALVGMGAASLAVYRANGLSPPDPIRVVWKLGMVLSVVSTVGVVIFQRFRQLADSARDEPFDNYPEITDEPTYTTASTALRG